MPDRTVVQAVAVLARSVQRLTSMFDNPDAFLAAESVEREMTRPLTGSATEETTVEYQTLLTCMAVDGGPEDCCGCFNGRQNGESIEFFCNECGRVLFNAVAQKDQAHA